jgi:hypothetical protein
VLELMYEEDALDVRKGSKAFNAHSAHTVCCSPHWHMSALLQAWQTCCHSTTLLQGRDDVSNIGLRLSRKKLYTMQQLTKQLIWMWVEQESAACGTKTASLNITNRRGVVCKVANPSKNLEQQNA